MAPKTNETESRQMTESDASRVYLFVPPEEKREVQTRGALWDAQSKRWYVGARADRTSFARWLPDSAEDDEFVITSSHGQIAMSKVACEQCLASIDVICVFCESGSVRGDLLTQFTVSDISSVNEELEKQLTLWPNFRRTTDGSGELGNFANHCSSCGKPLEDAFLHSEPDQVFFDVPDSETGKISFSPLTGTIELDGDEHFLVR